jgi:hypothetical protein
VMYEWGDGERVVAKIVRVRGREATSDQAGGRATRQVVARTGDEAAAAAMRRRRRWKRRA